MNNVLGAILALASGHIGSQPVGSPLHEALATICKATERGGQMVKNLLNFARQSPAELRVLDLNAILRDESRLLERTTLAKVRIQLELEAGLRPILGEASALSHVVMNLCVNAVDAMPGGGTLKLRTRNADPGWIELAVEDTGAGMPPEVLEKAMDPFFTTKEVGKGTGLGLSMAYSTVTAHHGQLQIRSEPGQGTCVTLRFPACEPAGSGLEPGEPEELVPPRRALAVLIIDDDELIQRSLQLLLQMLGHTAQVAQSGEEALERLQGGAAPELIILDMNMPGMGGAATLPRVRALLPQVPVMLSTGRTDDAALALAAAWPGVSLLAKPFGLRELRQQIGIMGLG